MFSKTLKDFAGEGKLLEVFKEVYPDILQEHIISDSDFIARAWSKYPQGEKSLNGKYFEAILSILFYKKGLLPFFIQANLAFIPNVNFDFVLYSKEYGPIVLSAKTSLRERYKQADLEGMMLRQVYRKSKCFLITLNHSEANSVNQKISNGEVLGIDQVVCADTADFDTLIQSFSAYTLIDPQPIAVITGAKKFL